MQKTKTLQCTTHYVLVAVGHFFLSSRQKNGIRFILKTSKKLKFMSKLWNTVVSVEKSRHFHVVLGKFIPRGKHLSFTAYISSVIPIRDSPEIPKNVINNYI